MPPNKKVIDCFNRSKQCYQDYLSQGKRFAQAKHLKQANLALYQELTELEQDAPSKIQAEIKKIKKHLDTWLSLWRQHKEQTQAKDNDEFVFENKDRFPFEAEQAIIKWLI